MFLCMRRRAILKRVGSLSVVSKVGRCILTRVRLALLAGKTRTPVAEKACWRPILSPTMASAAARVPRSLGAAMN